MQKTPTATALIELAQVDKSFRTADGSRRVVLEGVDLTLHEGEIVALLGKSGSGKSTLLRIIAGLIPADAGQVRYRGQTLYGPARGIAMVFQSFALFPWLTVQQNVELGLEAQGIAKDERAPRAAAAIELIGLSGFEGALPRELSGGMRQRVGIARALVMNPDILLMDEAFSALDVLTGENLRNDMLELWDDGRTPIKSLLVVSHNIEEAVLMADRILILSSDPGRVRVEIPITLARPRDPDSAEVRALIDEVYAQMTMSPDELAGLAELAGHAASGKLPVHRGYRLPDAQVGQMEGVLEILAEAPFNGRADLPQLSEESELSDEELLPVYEALRLLELVHIAQGDITLTALGLHYYHADATLRRDLFGQQVLQHVPLASEIRHSLEQEESGELAEEPFLRRLEEFMEASEAERALKIAIEWGRYGEVFEYDYHTGLLKLPETD